MAYSFLFVYQDQTNIIVLLVYVDYVIIRGSSEVLIEQVITKLNTNLDLKDLDHLRYFLGLEVHFFSGGLFLTLCKYTRDILHYARMLQALSLSIPVIMRDPFPCLSQSQPTTSEC